MSWRYITAGDEPGKGNIMLRTFGLVTSLGLLSVAGGGGGGVGCRAN